jgi:hypothetical protein
MKVYNLACPLDHRFEGWFASEADAFEQQTNGMLVCPICNSQEIRRLLSAPRIGKHVGRDLDAPKESRSGFASPEIKANMDKGLTNQLPINPIHSSGNSMVLSDQQQGELQEKIQATVLNVMRDIISKTEDVGHQFAQEARKIHYKEVPERSIRGQATADETAELREEGIEVVPLPFIPALKDTLQ